MTYLLCSCTAQKKEIPIPELDIKTSTATTMEEQRSIWQQNLQKFFRKNTQCQVLVREMYLGSIWVSIRNMLKHPFIDGGLVMSAGLGLVDFQQKIPSYASTFVAGDADSILGAGNLKNCREWWYALHSKDDFQDWLKKHPNPKIISILPQSYLHIAEELLEQFVESYGTQNLLILSPNIQSPILRSSCWVKTDSKMTHIVGGKMGDVSVRVLEWIVNKYPNQKVDFTQVRKECLELYEACRNLEPILQMGEKQSDQEILEWISQTYQTHSGISRSTAHKKLREEGRACSTSRFQKLFKTFLESQQGSLFSKDQF